MHVLYFILFLLAVICFLADAVPQFASRFNLTALGLAFATAVFLIQQARVL